MNGNIDFNGLINMAANAIIHQQHIEEMQRLLTDESIKWVFGEYAMYLIGKSTFDVSQFGREGKEPTAREVYLIRMIEQHEKDTQGYQDKCEQNRKNAQSRYRKEEAEQPSPAPAEVKEEKAVPAEVSAEDEQLIDELVIDALQEGYPNPLGIAKEIVEYNKKDNWSKIRKNQTRKQYCSNYLHIKYKDKPKFFAASFLNILWHTGGVSMDLVKRLIVDIKDIKRDENDSMVILLRNAETYSMLQASLMSEERKRIILRGFKSTIPYKSIKAVLV